MAKKKSRKSRRTRKAQTGRAPQPQTVTQVAPTPSTEAATQTLQKRTLKGGNRGLNASDFVREYAYVYFDLRKMFTVAAVMFALLIIVNLILTRLVVL